MMPRSNKKSKRDRIRTTIDVRGGLNDVEMQLCAVAVREGKGAVMLSETELVVGLDQFQHTELNLFSLQRKRTGNYLLSNGRDGNDYLLDWLATLVIQYNVWQPVPMVTSQKIVENYLPQTPFEVWDAHRRIEMLLPHAVNNAWIQVQTYRAANSPLQQQQAAVQQQYLQLQQQQQQTKTNGIRDIITATAQSFGNHGRQLEESQKQTAEIQNQTAEIRNQTKEISNMMTALFASSNKRHDNSEQRLDGHDVDIVSLKDRVHQLELNSHTPKKASASGKTNGGTPPVVQTVTEDSDD